MFIVYICVAVVLLVASFIGCLVVSADECIENEEFLIALRWFSLWTLGGWSVAILWPLLLASVVPVLCVYGAVTAVKAYKHQALDYGTEER